MELTEPRPSSDGGALVMPAADSCLRHFLHNDQKRRRLPPVELTGLPDIELMRRKCFAPPFHRFPLLLTTIVPGIYGYQDQTRQLQKCSGLFKRSQGAVLYCLYPTVSG